MMLIDAHAHLNFNAYRDDVDMVIKRSLDNQVWMINVGSQYSTSKRAVEIAKKYPEGVYAAVGLHPIHVCEEEFYYEKYKELAHSTSSGQAKSKVVAIGEIGLDYKSEYVLFKEKQKEVFLKQLNLAQELKLPVIFHCRMAHDDLTETLNKQRTTNNEQLKGVIHCFTGSRAQAGQYLDMGFYLGFNGIIFKLNLDKLIKEIPLDKILVETDCPYLTPLQKEGRNEPLYVKYVVERIAKIKKLSYEEISKVTTENARKLFRI